MPDDRKCPLCGANHTRLSTFSGGQLPFREQRCVSINCQLLCQLWDRIEQLQRERNGARAEVEQLNQMLHETGYGQGQIDAYMDEIVDRHLGEDNRIKMPDDRKCPLCGGDGTRFGTSYGDDEPERVTWGFEHQECVNKDCKLPCRLWDRIEELKALT